MTEGHPRERSCILGLVPSKSLPSPPSSSKPIPTAWSMVWSAGDGSPETGDRGAFGLVNSERKIGKLLKRIGFSRINT